ncbi:MAG: F0F1 ATP synthase subunit A [Candidatus Levybacteria bacterium]|nr:F0F1 ATP synthase subunit A [Candidatus Levybacteria bacterium]
MAAFAPEVLFHIGSFPITNTVLNTLLVDAGLIGGAYYIKKNIQKVPRLFQNIVEMVIQSFYDITETISGRNAVKIFPYFMSFFLFILLANWSNLIPGIGTFGFLEQGEHGETEIIPFLRGTTSDANTTFALAFFSLVATHILAIRAVGIGEYLSRYFSLNPIMLFVGILEIVSEVTKVVSLSFRLFGNIFAGEVVLHTVSSLFAFLVPIPFMLLEIIVGLVQALVFAMLTMVFMSILMTPHSSEH